MWHPCAGLSIGLCPPPRGEEAGESLVLGEEADVILRDLHVRARVLVVLRGLPCGPCSRHGIGCRPHLRQSRSAREEMGMLAQTTGSQQHHRRVSRSRGRRETVARQAERALRKALHWVPLMVPRWCMRERGFASRGPEWRRRGVQGPTLV